MAATKVSELALPSVTMPTAFSDELLRRSAAAHDSVNELGHASSGRRMLRVLVVDDEQDTTDGLVGLVRGCGHAARMADTGLAALRAAAVQRPDVVLLDIERRFMDGCQLASQLRLDPACAECLVISVVGWADDERRQQCIEAGIDVLLIKPFDPSVVETLLMLECVHVNRARPDNSAGAGNGGPQAENMKRPSDAVARDRAAAKWLARLEAVAANSYPGEALVTTLLGLGGGAFGATLGTAFGFGVQCLRSFN